jgi:hypothetical protein
VRFVLGALLGAAAGTVAMARRPPSGHHPPQPRYAQDQRAGSAQHGRQPSGGDQPQRAAARERPHERHDASDERHKRRECWYWAVTGAMSVAAAIATGTAAWYAYGAFTQAQRQADTAQQALIASDRPWLMLTDVNPASLSSDDEFGVSFWVNMVAKNVGHSPAQNVSVSARLLIVENSGPRPDVAMHAICREARESPIVIPGQVVFPDQTEDINQGTPNSFIIPAETVWAVREARIRLIHNREMARNRPERAEAWAADLSKFPFHAALYFIGCVNYRSSDNRLFFQTPPHHG